MDCTKRESSISLTIPADMEFALVARMALSGFGMLAGLEVDLIDDLRTVTDECCDCLLHQSVEMTKIEISARVEENRLCCRFCGVPGDKTQEEPQQDKEVTRCILETLLSDVQLHCEAGDVCCIEFSMPV